MTVPATNTEKEKSEAPVSIALPNGLIGLPQTTQLQILRNSETWPLVTLQSPDPEGLHFLAIEPQDLVADYVIELNDLDTEALGITRADNVQVLNLVTVHSTDPQYVTTNLIGPVIVNRHTLAARQVILANSDRYSAWHVLVDERT